MLLLVLVWLLAAPVYAAPGDIGHFGHLIIRQKDNFGITPDIFAQQQTPPQTGAENSAGLVIALILPVNTGGIIGRAAAGFYDECQNNTAARFVLYATDGTAGAAIDSYNKAIADGADVIVGPMLRGSVAELVRQIKNAPLPTLLLHPGGDGDNYFFITADAGRESAALADLMFAAGATEVLIVLQESGLAKRQMLAFAEQWQKSGGWMPEVVSIKDFNIKNTDWRALFDRQREAAEDERRIAVFAAGDAAFVRRVRHFTPSYHPVFAGSFSYDGAQAAFADDITIMAMPELLTPPDSLMSVVERRFRALGGDACNIAAKVGLWDSDFRYSGKSGELHLRGIEFWRRGILARQVGGKLHQVSHSPFAPLHND